MSEIGILKECDKLGRIVIPKELRERYALNSEVEIIATKDGILIKNPKYILTKKEENVFQKAIKKIAYSFALLKKAIDTLRDVCYNILVDRSYSYLQKEKSYVRRNKTVQGALQALR